MKKFNISNILVGVVFIVALVLSLGTVYKAFFVNDFDLWISKVKTTVKDGLLNYSLSIKGTEGLKNDAVVSLIYNDGTTETFTYQTTKKDFNYQFTSPKQLEYVQLAAPATQQEKNIQNNIYNISHWSDSVMLMDSYAEPDFSYLVDSEGRVWFVSSGREGTGKVLGIHLTILDAKGQIVLYKGQISDPEVYSTYPVIRMIDNQAHIFWCTGEGQLVHHIYELTSGELVSVATKVISTPDVAYLKPVVANNAPADNSLLVMTESKGMGGFVLYRLKGIEAEQQFQVNFPEVLLTHYDQVAFDKDEQGNTVLAWGKYAARKTLLSLTKINPEGKILINQPNVVSIASERRDVNPLLLQTAEGYALFYSDYYAAMEWNSSIGYITFDDDLNINADKVILENHLALHVTGYVDEGGNINLAWCQNARAKSGVNYELFFTQLDSHLQVIIPKTRVTFEQTDKLLAHLQGVDGYRYLVWRQYKDNFYSLHIASTAPAFNGNDTGQDVAKSSWLQAVVEFFVAETIPLLQTLFFSFATIVLLSCLFIWGASLTAELNKPFAWVTFLLVLLCLQFNILGGLGLYTAITANLANRIITLLFAVQFLVFYLVNRKNGKQQQFGWKFAHILSWAMLSNVTVVLINYLNQ